MIAAVDAHNTFFFFFFLHLSAAFPFFLKNSSAHSTGMSDVDAQGASGGGGGGGDVAENVRLHRERRDERQRGEDIR